MKYSVEVEANLPSGVTLDEWITYVRDSVSSNIGMHMPEEPIWHLDRASVVVRRMPKIRRPEVARVRKRGGKQEHGR